MPSELLPGGHFWLILRFQLEADLPLLIPRPKIPVTFDSKSMIKKALHSFFLPASPSFAETFRMIQFWRHSGSLEVSNAIQGEPWKRQKQLTRAFERISEPDLSEKTSKLWT